MEVAEFFSLLPAPLLNSIADTYYSNPDEKPKTRDVLIDQMALDAIGMQFDLMAKAKQARKLLVSILQKYYPKSDLKTDKEQIEFFVSALEVCFVFI